MPIPVIHPDDKEFLRHNPLLIASHNKGKAGEIMRQLQKISGLAIVTPDDVLLSSPEEPYQTFRENAACKAQNALETTNLACVADDSGLVIPALDGAPGVHTADWFTNTQGQRCFETGFERLSRALEGKTDRTAVLVATLAVFFPSGRHYFFEAELQGVLLTEPVKGRGYGFDPIFQPQGSPFPLSAMSDEQRATLSPRAQAAAQICASLRVSTP